MSIVTCTAKTRNDLSVARIVVEVLAQSWGYKCSVTYNDGKSFDVMVPTGAEQNAILKFKRLCPNLDIYKSDKKAMATAKTESRGRKMRKEGRKNRSDPSINYFKVDIEDHGKEFTLELTKNSDKWREKVYEGERPDNFTPKSYMSYLKPNDILSWLRQDFEYVSDLYDEEYEDDDDDYDEDDYDEYDESRNKIVKENIEEDIQKKILRMFDINGVEVKESYNDKGHFWVVTRNTNSFRLGELLDDLRKLEDMYDIGYEDESNDEEGFYAKIFEFYYYSEYEESKKSRSKSESRKKRKSESYSHSTLEELVSKYKWDYEEANISLGQIYDEIVSKYNDEDLANDVLDALAASSDDNDEDYWG